MSKDTGGPAFPAEEIDDDQSVSQNRIVVKEMHLGMSLRDYFAAKAMNAIAPMAFKKTDGNGCGLTPAGIEMAKDIAAVVYSIADAMLAERNK